MKGAGGGEEGLKGRIERLSAAIHSGTELAFEKLGTVVVDNPWWTIGACLLFTAALGQGVWFFDEELSSDKQFTPRGSQAVKEETWVVDTFGHENRGVTMMFEGNENTNMLAKTSLLYMQSMHEWLLSQTLTVDGEHVTYNTVCARYTPHDACKSPVSILSYWQHNRTLLEADANPLNTVNTVDWRDIEPSGPPLSYYLGSDVTRNTAGKLASTRAASISYNLKNEQKEVSGLGVDDPQSRYFEIQSAEKSESRRSADRTEHGAAVFLMTTGQEEEAGDSAISSDVSNLAMGYVLMLAYASFVLSRSRAKYSHSVMGVISVVSTGLSTFSAYGFCWFIGVKFNSVVQVLILVLLGVGIDDTFVIMDSWWDCGHIPSMRERMIGAIKHAGPAITVTSVTDLIAFLAGSSTELPALKDFCYYATVGITFDFAFQCTFVVAIAYLDSLRQDRSRSDLLCCLVVADDDAMGPCCCVKKETPPGWTETERGLQARVIGTHLPRFIIGTNIGRGFVMVVSAFFLGYGAYGCTNVKMNYNNEWFVPDNHAYQDVLSVRDRYFKGTDLPASVYYKALDYANEQHIVIQGSEVLKKNPWVVSKSTSSWMEDFHLWVRQNHGYAWEQMNGGRVATTQFYPLLKSYASTSTGPRSGWQHIDNIRWDTNNNSLIASRIGYLIVGDALTEGESAVEAMDSLRTDLQETTAFPWTKAFVFWESYKLMIGEITRNVAIAGSCVFVLVTVMIANLQQGLLVTLAIGCVDVCMLGFMPVVGVELNGVSVICIVLAVGLSVDYSVHVAGAFLLVRCDDDDMYSGRAQRAAFAIWKMGPAVVNGGLSTFIAILPAALAISYVFKVFFRMFALIIFFGQWFGVLLLPVMLSFVGPDPYLTAKELNADPRQNPLHLEHGGVSVSVKKTSFSGEMLSHPLIP